ncbi:MAG: hypothetical protein M3083_16970 [Actinomycetota bacterium]|nr:hypothetical protein [Actinomycetota bacterium]
MARRLLLVVTLVLCSGALPAGALPAGTGPLVSSTRQAVAQYADPVVAGAAGYQPASVSNRVEHWLNPALSRHGPVLNPRRPQGLVYVETGHGLLLVAALFVLDHPGQRPPRVPGAAWHHHRWCQGDGGIGFPLPGAPCPPGTSLRVGPDMLHVWMANVRIDPFASDMTPRLACLLSGRPGLL